MRQILADRFWSKVEKTATCWNWTRALDPAGYGVIAIDGKMKKAHRVAYELEVGPIPEDKTLDHLCRNRRCVNPAHLEPVTHRENVLRGIGPAAKHSKQTHCIHGHELTGPNLYVRKDGRRQCLTCIKDRKRRRP